MPEVIWPVKPIQDKDGNPFYPKGHAKATVCTDGLTVEQHLAGLEGFATATPSGDGYTIDTDFVFREGSKVTVKFTDASVADQPFITLSDGINYPIMKSNGGSAKITAGSYVSLICGTNSFILSGEGGEYGTATSTEVLAGFTLGTENGVVDGSIPIITGTGADSNKIDTEQGIAGALDGDSINYAYLAIQPNSFYKNVSWVRKPEPDLISACIAKGATILGVQGSASVIDTSTATATAADIILGKTAGVNGNMVTGTIPSKEAETIVPTTTNKVIAAGQYLAGDQIVVGDANFVEANIKHGITMFGKTGTFTNDGTLAANKMLSGVIGYSKGTKFTGTIASKGATTITPKTTNQTISSGVYLSGNITILGSSNLIASNIKSGVNIFGVIGSYTGIAGIPSSYLDYTDISIGATSSSLTKYLPCGSVIKRFDLVSGRMPNITIILGTSSSDEVSSHRVETNIRAGYYNDNDGNTFYEAGTVRVYYIKDQYMRISSFAKGITTSPLEVGTIIPSNTITIALFQRSSLFPTSNYEGSLVLPDWDYTSTQIIRTRFNGNNYYVTYVWQYAASIVCYYYV